MSEVFLGGIDAFFLAEGRRFARHYRRRVLCLCLGVPSFTVFPSAEIIPTVRSLEGPAVDLPVRAALGTSLTDRALRTGSVRTASRAGYAACWVLPCAPYLRLRLARR